MIGQWLFIAASGACYCLAMGSGTDRLYLAKSLMTGELFIRWSDLLPLASSDMPMVRCALMQDQRQGDAKGSILPRCGEMQEMNRVGWESPCHR
jgi:hypothetical protein